MPSAPRIHTMKIREQFAVPIMSAGLKAITRLNSKGYNAGDYLRFKVIPMLNDSDRWMTTTTDERSRLERSFFRITFVMSGRGIKEGYVTLSIEQVSEPNQIARLGREVTRSERDRDKGSDSLSVYDDLLEGAYPEAEVWPKDDYRPVHGARSLDALAAEATAASEHDASSKSM